MNLRQAHLISCIHTLFGNDERLIYFFFNHKRPEIRLGADELLKDAKCLSRGEYLLIQAALDLWNGEGRLQLADALKVLDDENLLALVRAILRLRDVEFSEESEC